MAKTNLLNFLKVLMILISASWISLWLLKPTQLWTRQWHKAEDSARSTLFGYYGLNFAVYTFPVIAVAIIGQLYLNFKSCKRQSRNARVSSASTLLSNPVIVNCIVGVISGIEILVISLFVLFLAWTFYARISNDFSKLKPIKSLKLKIWELKYLRVATRFGLLAEACLALLLLPILRGMALFRLIGIQFEASVKYHVWLGTAMLFFATFHGVSTLFIWGVSHHIQDEVWQWQKTGRIYIAGEVALVTGLVIWITALPQVRRKKFELFYYTHHLYVVFLLFFLFHAGDRHFYMVFPGIFLFALDKLLRIIQSRPETCILSARILPCKVIELFLPKDPELNYVPTSVVYVKVPSISRYQWHAFSITSSSKVDQCTMSVIIKCDGSWTSSLYQTLNADTESDADRLKCIPIAIEGPYGPASMDFLRYDSLLLVAGGIGITPFLSILQELASSQNEIRYKLPTRIQLIHVVRKSQDILLLNSISPLLFNHSPGKLHLKLKVFVTKEEQSSGNVREILHQFSQTQTIINFSTRSSNYAIQGLENPLWMAALAGISSILFVTFLICFNHVAVPSEKKMPAQKKDKTPSWVSDLLLISAFVLSIICGTILTIVLRWRKYKRDQFSPIFRKQENNGETSSIANRLDEHEIHFGGRPNFQDILSKFSNEIGGQNIGVLVCGPESMKECVALVCKQNSQVFKMDANKKPYFNFHSLNFTL